jgi:hypothetical protein
VGDTASHSANAWESTGMGFKGGPPPVSGEHAPNPVGDHEAPHKGPQVK